MEQRPQGTASQEDGNQGNPSSEGLGGRGRRGHSSAGRMGRGGGTWLPLLTTPHCCPAAAAAPASTLLFPLEQIVAGIVGYLNLHIIPSSVLH